LGGSGGGEAGVPLVFCDGSVFARSWGEPTGLPLLCWHGAGGSCADYACVAPALADRLGARVVAIDGPGHAQSWPRTADAFRPSALARLASEILDELDAAQTVFLGFSWGATVGCWFAALNPERTIALALVEGGHFDFADLSDFRTDRTLDEFVADAEASAARDGEEFGMHTPAVAGAMVYGLCREPATASYSRLAESRTPVLFLGASGNASAVEVERLSRLVPQSKVVQLPSSSHELLRDAPNDVAGELSDWLAQFSNFEK
jgi:pimeloyl-ACP methyl ester carboxylesterase